jgi:DNA-directed RNA polymerase specialized sigma24 family protein
MDADTSHWRIEELLGESSWLSALARELVADRALADDVAQQTWVAALRTPSICAASTRLDSLTLDVRPQAYTLRCTPIRYWRRNARRRRGRRFVISDAIAELECVLQGTTGRSVGRAKLVRLADPEKLGMDPDKWPALAEVTIAPGATETLKVP